MIRALVVADSGTAMASITASLSSLLHVEIAGYASGRARLAAVVEAVMPEVVLIDEMRHPGQALERIAEMHALQPGVAVIGLADGPESAWVGAALRAGATAVVPRGLEAATLGLVLREALAETSVGHVGGAPVADALGGTA
jgi:DNA-binding NarL/FixJ family response regulator